MTEIGIVRQNLMDDVNYRPYCGNQKAGFIINGCYNSRTVYIVKIAQFRCPNCSWVSEFPDEFIQRYKAKHNLKDSTN